MLGVGNDIVEPNLMGKKLDGEKLSKLFSQKTVWLLPEKDLLDSSQHPITSVQSPIFNAEYPTTSLEYSPTNAECSTTNAECSTTNAEYPTTSAEYPTTNAECCTTNAEYPTTSAEYPTTNAEYPTTNAEYPTTSAEYPTTNAECCTTNAEYPTTSAEYPTTNAECSTTSAEFPMAVAQLSTSRTQFSGSKYTQSSTSTNDSTQHPSTNGKFFAGRDQFTTTNDVPSTSTQTPMSNPQSTICGTTHAHFPTTSTPLTSDECKVQLHEMFPNKELPTIEDAMASSTDLEEAINKLLNATDENGK